MSATNSMLKMMEFVLIPQRGVASKSLSIEIKRRHYGSKLASNIYSNKLSYSYIETDQDDRTYYSVIDRQRDS